MLVTCGKHFHYRIFSLKGDDWAPRTSIVHAPHTRLIEVSGNVYIVY